jgi:hypothetical protein
MHGRRLGSERVPFSAKYGRVRVFLSSRESSSRREGRSVSARHRLERGSAVVGVMVEEQVCLS